MLSISRVKELLGDSSISDDQAEKIRDAWRAMAELVLESLGIIHEQPPTAEPPEVRRTRLDWRKRRVVG